MNWVQLGGSIVAILILSGIAWGLKLGTIAPIDDDQAACAIAEADLSGFDAARACLSHDRRSAVVFGYDRSIALIRPHGAHYVVRRVRNPQATRAGQFIEIDSGDRRFGRFALRLTDHAAATALLRDLHTGTATDIGVGNPA